MFKILVLAIIAANSIDCLVFTDCGTSSGKVTSISVAVCPISSDLKCPAEGDFKAGTNATIDVNFNSEVNSNTATVKVWGITSSKDMNLFEPTVATESATFALSCFWGPDAQFGCADGVIRTRVGYTGGTTRNPTYHNLADHTETVDLEFDPNVTSYQVMDTLFGPNPNVIPQKLLDMFWANHSPITSHKKQYMTAIFYNNQHQKELAEKSMQEIQKKYSKPIVTKILALDVFYEAEDYHQKYRLRRHKDIVKSLGLNDKQLIRSHVAARLNGYLAGFGTVERFTDEVDNWGLNEEQKNYILDQMKCPVEGGFC